MRRAVIHEPTRKAVAIISPNVLMGKLPIRNNTGYIGARAYGRARGPSNQLAANGRD
jgi:hypothetical protein